VDAGTILGYLIVAGLGVLGTIAAARYLERRPDLRYQVRSSGDLLPQNPEVPLQIRYEGIPVKRLVQLKTRLANEGNYPVEAVDVKFELETTGREIHWICPEPDRIVVLGRHHARITLLNPGEETHCEILVADDVEPRLRVTARGVGVIGRPVEPPPNFQLVFWLTFFVGLLLDFGYFLILQPLVDQAIANPWLRLVLDVAPFVLFLGGLGLIGMLLLGSRFRAV